MAVISVKTFSYDKEGPDGYPSWNEFRECLDERPSSWSNDPNMCVIETKESGVIVLHRDGTWHHDCAPNWMG